MSFDRLDLSSDPNLPDRASRGDAERTDASNGAPTERQRRKFIGMKFNCCGLYVHIYVNKSGTAYEGRCPKCGKPVRLKIGQGGTESRFFEAY